MDLDSCAWADLAERLPQQLPAGTALELQAPPLAAICIGTPDPAWPSSPLAQRDDVQLRAAPQQRPLLDHLLVCLIRAVQESASFSAELAATYGRLALLDELGRILPACADAAAVGRGLGMSLADTINGCGCLLQYRERAWQVLAQWGAQFHAPQAEELAPLLERQRPLIVDDGATPESLGLQGARGAWCCLPVRGPEGPEGLLLLARVGGPVFASDEAMLAEMAAVQVAGYLLKLRRDRDLQEAALLEHEVGLAGRIQKQLLPRSLPEPEGWNLAASLRSARLVGGDYYDVIDHEGSLYLVVADVSGHSVSAALAMNMVRTALRAALPQVPEPGDLIAALNHQLSEDLFAATLFVSLSVLRLEPENGCFILANAGHPPVLQRHHDGRVSILDADGCVLGLQAEQQPVQLHGELLPGDSLILYTDGITECCSPAGECFGEHRLQQVFAQGPVEAGPILRHVDAQVQAWSSTSGDDSTLLVCSRRLSHRAPRQCRLL